MLIFFLILLVTFFFAVIPKNESHTCVYLIILSFFLVLFSGGRALGSSPDDLNYFYSLYYVYGEFEYLYYVLELINIEYFGSSIEVQFFVMALLSIFTLMLTLFRYKSIALWSLLIYMVHIYLYRDLIQIRAAVAYNIVLLGFIFLLERKSLYKFFLAVILASGFHISSIIALVALFLRKIKLTVKTYLILVFIAFSISILGFKSVIVYIASLIPFLGVYLNTYVLDEGGFSYSVGFLNPTILKSIIFSIILLSKKERVNLFFNDGLLINLYCFSVLILVSLNEFAVLSARAASLFSSVEILLIPAIIIKSSRNEKVFLFLFFFISYLSVFILNLFFKDMLSNYRLGFL
ncbi:EpsG family protein [Vibrio mimicus]|uniref:EpsG family protein n=1 Tax=Vibrio mimicus TaxID=674 RepID=UPI0011D3A9CE|nr:EpsG family protein [Vibrio mimicus]BCN22255.1 putative O-antigen polymerase [Vibrio mimicus]BCN22564.1 putative O-antigen polymerase [Vibrio mimicus]